MMDEECKGTQRGISTQEWAAQHGVCAEEKVLPAWDGLLTLERSTKACAERTIVLHGMAAVGSGAEANEVVDWFEEQGLWAMVSERERVFLRRGYESEAQRIEAQWRMEAQWALLWALDKFDSLGLPTRTCDTAKLVDEIMPRFGESVRGFVEDATFRSIAEISAEDERIYNLHCYARRAFERGIVPHDLVYPVLYQRHFAFEWLRSEECIDWDDVTADT